MATKRQLSRWIIHATHSRTEVPMVTKRATRIVFMMGFAWERGEYSHRFAGVLQT
ncbi:hypothetical protein ACFPN1_11415 [Lysobacter yangpyeongensis]|jgi:hypothetical protein|uniref:Uncharacterized protein n=1 Tax=Lysobacter yangpyeongensis TaxID=346182 RepID=A0ABW0SNW5_9GAMM